MIKSGKLPACPAKSGMRALLVHAHQTCARGEADAESDDHRRAGPFLLARQHKAGRSAGKISEVLKHVIRLVYFRRFRVDVELRADAIENLLAARMNHAVVHFAYVFDR